MYQCTECGKYFIYLDEKCGCNAPVTACMGSNMAGTGGM